MDLMMDISFAKSHHACNTTATVFFVSLGLTPMEVAVQSKQELDWTWCLGMVNIPPFLLFICGKIWDVYLFIVFFFTIIDVKRLLFF